MMNAMSTCRNVTRPLAFATTIIAVTALASVLGSCASGVSRTQLASDYYDIANAYYDAGKNDKAAEYYARAISLNPNLAQANFNLARIYITTGKIQDALAVLDQLLKKDPTNLMLHETHAYALAKEGKYKEALSEYNDVLDRNPYSLGALFNAALIEHSLKNTDRAYALMNRAHAVAPDNNDVLLKVGTYASEVGDNDEAIRDLEDYVAKQPDDLAALQLLAHLYDEQKYYDRALSTYDIILKKKQTPDLLFQKARILLTAVQDAETGLTALEQALKAGFDNKDELKTLLSNKDLVGADTVKALIDQYTQSPDTQNPKKPGS